ncbi:MAG: DMT family transporter [Clostridia bacterium]|nr:DMT family transporter [Clostridia bacterium]
MVYILLAVVAGFSIILSRILNANLALKIGIYQGTFMNYIAGLSLSLLLLFLIPGGFSFSHKIPFLAYLGGFLGVLVLALSSYMTHRISNFNLTLLIFIGQLVMGVILDILLGNSVSGTKLIGGFLIFLGLAYNIYIDGTERKGTQPGQA